MRSGILLPAIVLIKRFEGLGDGDLDTPGLQPYVCPAGQPTLGWGSIYGLNGKRVTMRHPTISEAEAGTLMMRDVQPAYGAVGRLTKVPLSDNQAAALVDFVYNFGSGNYLASTLRAVINRGDYDEAPTQLRRWIYGGGRVLSGLVRRRKAEIRLWNS